MPLIAPQTHDTEVGPIPLMIWNRGKHLLTGVTVTIRNTREWGDPNTSMASFFRPPLEVGVVHPGWPKVLAQTIEPNPDSKTGVDTYYIEIQTQSEMYVEQLEFRKGHNAFPWAHRYRVTKEIVTVGLKHSETRQIMDIPFTRWSDDAGEGKPVTKP